MSDITTAWDIANGVGVWSMAGTSLASGDDLKTAVLISLFTDAAAVPGDPAPEGDRRGWWGDLDQPVSIGSKLWIYARSLQVPKTLLAIQDACAVALKWLIDDGIAARVTVVASFPAPSRIDVLITIVKPDGQVIPIAFGWAWQGLN